MPLIEGCRTICRIRHRLDDPENAVFLPIRGVDSETDHFPIGEARSKCAPDYLRRMDTEMERYLTAAREDILKGCREIIELFSTQETENL
jgi:hypothetical protein